MPIGAIVRVSDDFINFRRRATLLYMYFGGHLGITVWRTS